MDTSPQEKKWFVFIRDHHEGPFTLTEFKDKLLQGVINSQFYVWTEGMKDWEMMSRVESLRDLVSEAEVRNQKSISSVIKITSEAQVPHTDTGAVTSVAPIESEVVSPLAELQPLEEVLPTETVSAEEVSVTPIAEVPRPLKAVSDSEPEYNSFATREAPDPKFDVSKDSPFWKKIINVKLIALMIVVGVLVFLSTGGYLGILFRGFSPVVKSGQEGISSRFRPVIIELIEKVPMLANWISPLPPMQDVSTIDFEEMKQVAIAPFVTEGPKAAFALSQSDLINPTFKVASNLADGSVFELITIGVPETLVGATEFTQQLEVPVFQRHGKSAALRAPGGAPIPKGEFWIYMVESLKQPLSVQQQLKPFSQTSKNLPPQVPTGRKVVVSKKVFLGGERDKVYEAELKKYHEEIGVQALKELTEIEKNLLTLNEYLLKTIENYARLQSGPKKRTAIAIRNLRNNWKSYHDLFQKQQSMLDPVYAGWTEEGLKSTYHASLFQSLVRVRYFVQGVHKLQSQYVDQQQVTASEAAVLSQSALQAQDEIKNLQKKIHEIRATPFDPTNLPPRGNS